MKHKKCGGKFIWAKADETKKLYVCNRCGKMVIKYRNKRNKTQVEKQSNE